MIAKVLQTREMPECHTEVNTAERLRLAAEEWKIIDRVSCLVDDNASNVTLKASNMEGWGHFGCFAHTLQLCVQYGLNDSAISRLTAQCRKLVSHFNHSVVATTALKEKQKQFSIAEHHLVQDVSTRWNSTFFMFERLVEQHWAIYAVLHDENVTSSDHCVLDLKPEQWDLIQQLTVVLKPLQVATTALSGELKVTVSLIYPVVNGLLSNHLNVGSQDVPTVQRFKETVRKELSSRFCPDSLETATEIHVIAALTDPCYHQLKFLNTEQ